MTLRTEPLPDLHMSARMLIALAIIAVFGVASLLTGTMVGPFYVPDYDPVADTISDLAAGEAEIIMDVALYGFAAGLTALALGVAHAHQGGLAWTTGTLSLAVLAATVVVVGARNEYGDGDNEGVVIHIYLVYMLGLLFTVMPLCLAPRIGRLLPWARTGMLVTGLMWAALSPVFFFLPTGMDGLYERGLGAVACAQVLICAAALLAYGRGLQRDSRT
jgi:hypothetical protein